MAFTYHQLYSTPGRRQLGLRELTAGEELMPGLGGTAGLLPLLDALMSNVDGQPQLSAAAITVADRDYLLAELYQRLFGPRIESILNCRSCKARIDLSFHLGDLLTHRRSMAVNAPVDSDGFYFPGQPGSFRLPTGADEMAISGLDAADAEFQLTTRCLADIGSGTGIAAVQERMEAVAPLMSLDMQADCPECRQTQTVHFDMQRYFAMRMLQEQQQVMTEIHCIAAAYHWSHHEIISLPRSQRKTYAGLIRRD